MVTNTSNSGQHFLLSAQARTLSVLKVARMTDDQAHQLFKELRWGEGEEVTCPNCGDSNKHYFIKTRRQWRCKSCQRSFSVTSGTIFANHKLPLTTYLVAIAIYTNAVKGISSLQLSRDLGVQYKTAFVLSHKLRESLMIKRDETPLSGEVHIDGAYVNGSIRPANQKKNRVDTRLEENQKPGKCCVVVMHQKVPEEKGHGADRTITAVVKNENRKDVGKLAEKYISPDAIVCADESKAYDGLHATNETHRVKHAERFRAKDGTTNNQAESYFSRLRRMQYGQVHRFGQVCMEDYANEAAYREDTRRVDNGGIFRDIVEKCARSKNSRNWSGYWQGNKKPRVDLETGEIIYPAVA
ncbi:MAG: IS1595 family transposase [Methylomonas sp.]|jgi:transposase-like protein|uniref:IS1595 family transposase n=1 Tax=Methylomonas sp. TaxID=418 RepID=UPI0025CFDFE3|nr:IS1595 family transposase [Methylomonas sp.]MCK9607462.1 IS1595 family transposase [Methylomonas sp.]